MIREALNAAFVLPAKWVFAGPSKGGWDSFDWLIACTLAGIYISLLATIVLAGFVLWADP